MKILWDFAKRSVVVTAMFIGATEASVFPDTDVLINRPVTDSEWIPIPPVLPLERVPSLKRILRF